MEEDDALMTKAMELARGLACGPRSLGLIRQMYWAGMDNDYSTQLGVEAKMQSRAGMTQDFQEGVAAFREKRPARFRGE